MKARLYYMNGSTELCLHIYVGYLYLGGDIMNKAIINISRMKEMDICFYFSCINA